MNTLTSYVMKGNMINLKIFDETKGEKSPFSMHDATRPYVVVGQVRRGYRSGVGFRNELVGRYTTLAAARSAKRRAESA